ncbi:MAG: hypothetical protein Q9170_002923 [Blastenia crenularia]
MSCRKPHDVEAWEKCLQDGEERIGQARLANAAPYSTSIALVPYLKANKEYTKIINSSEGKMFGWETIADETLQNIEVLHGEIHHMPPINPPPHCRYLYLIFHYPYTSDSNQHSDKTPIKLLIDVVAALIDSRKLLDALKKDVTMAVVDDKLGSVVLYVEKELAYVLMDAFKSLHDIVEHGYDSAADKVEVLRAEFAAKIEVIRSCLEKKLLPSDEEVETVVERYERQTTQEAASN